METVNHYKRLYSHQETVEANLKNVLQTSNIQKLNEEEKHSLENKLSYEEMLSSLKHVAFCFSRKQWIYHIILLERFGSIFG